MKWKKKLEDPNENVLKELHIELWKAINKYVKTCGGDPGKKTVSVKRELAVVEIEKLVEKLQEKYIGKCAPPYLGNPVWESQHELSISLLNIKDSL